MAGDGDYLDPEGADADTLPVPNHDGPVFVDMGVYGVYVRFVYPLKGPQTPHMLNVIVGYQDPQKGVIVFFQKVQNLLVHDRGVNDEGALFAGGVGSQDVAVAESVTAIVKK
jgi:hypothetical protein